MGWGVLFFRYCSLLTAYYLRPLFSSINLHETHGYCSIYREHSILLSLQFKQGSANLDLGEEYIILWWKKKKRARKKIGARTGLVGGKGRWDLRRFVIFSIWDLDLDNMFEMGEIYKKMNKNRAKDQFMNSSLMPFAWFLLFVGKCGEDVFFFFFVGFNV